MDKSTPNNHSNSNSYAPHNNGGANVYNLTCLLGLYDKLDNPYSVEEKLDNAHRGLRPEFRRVIKRKNIVDFEELAQIGKDWEAE